MKKSMCMSLLLVVSFICSLPRVSDSAVTGPLPVSGTAGFSHGSTWLAPFAFPAPGHNGLDMRLLHVRKFRRRRSHIMMQNHLSVSFLAKPPDQALNCFHPKNGFYLTREPDSLVHPPA